MASNATTDITLRIQLDAREVRAGMKGLVQEGRETAQGIARSIQQGMEGAVEAPASSSTAMDAVGEGAQRAEQKVRDAGESIEQAAQEASQSADTMGRRWAQAMRQGVAESAQQAAGEVRQAGAVMEQAGKQMGVSIRRPVQGAEDALQDLSDEATQTSARLEQAGERGGRGLRNVARGATGANRELRSFRGRSQRSNQLLFEMAAATEDAQYGFRSVSNQIPQLVEQFSFLKTQAGSTKGAFSALLAGLTGPGGLILAFTSLTALGPAVVSFFDDSADAAKRFKKAVDDAVSTLLEFEEDQVVAGVEFNEENIDQGIAALERLVKKQETTVDQMEKETAEMVVLDNVSDEVLKQRREEEKAERRRLKQMKKALERLKEQRASYQSQRQVQDALLRAGGRRVEQEEATADAIAQAGTNAEAVEAALRSYGEYQKDLARKDAFQGLSAAEKAGEKVQFLRSTLQSLNEAGVEPSREGVSMLREELNRLEQMRAQMEQGPLPERPEIPEFEGEDLTLEMQPLNLDQAQQQFNANLDEMRRRRSRFNDSIRALENERRRINGESNETILQENLARVEQELAAGDLTLRRKRQLTQEKMRLENQLLRSERQAWQERKRMVKGYAQQAISAFMSAAQAQREISETDVALQQKRFDEREAQLRESLRSREISRRTFELKMKKLAEERSAYEKRVERSRAGFMKRSARAVRKVAVQAIKRELSEYVASKAAELLLGKSTEEGKTAATSAGAATRAGAEVSASATTQAAKTTEAATHTAAESTKTGATLSGVATRMAAMTTEIAQSLASAAASMANAVAKVISSVASLGPLAIPVAAAAVGGLVAIYKGAKSALGFAEGGYTGEGSKREVAGVVHGGEYVFPQEAVRGDRKGFDGLMTAMKDGVTPDQLMTAAGLPGYADGGFVGRPRLTRPAARDGEADEGTAGGASADDVGRLARSVERLAEDVAEAKREPTPAVIGNEAARQAERAAAQERWRENAGASR